MGVGSERESVSFTTAIHVDDTLMAKRKGGEGWEGEGRESTDKPDG